MSTLTQWLMVGGYVYLGIAMLALVWCHIKIRDAVITMAVKHGNGNPVKTGFMLVCGCLFLIGACICWPLLYKFNKHAM